MTYQGQTKGIGIGKVPEGMKTAYARIETYANVKKRQETKQRREKVFSENAPKNPARRFFYNIQKRRMEK